MNEWKGSVMVYDPTAYLAPIDLISFLDMKHRSPYFVSGRQDNAIDWVTCGDEDTPCKSAGFVAQRNEKMDEHREIIVLDASYEFEPLKRMEVTIRSKDAGASHLSKMYLVPSKSYSFEESNRNDATSNSDANAKWHVQTDPPLSRGMVEGHSVLTISSISFVIGEQLQSKVESVFAFIECRCNIVYSIITTESLFALHIPVFAAENSNIELSDINLFDSTITNTQMSVFRNCCVDIDTLYVHNNNFQSSSFFSVEDLPSPSSSSSPSSFPSPLRSNTQMNGDISLSKCHFDSSQTNSPVFVIDCSLSFKLLISNVVFQTIGPIPEGPSIIYLKPKEKMHFLSEEQPVGNICIRINNCNFTECKSVCSYQGGIMHHRLSALSNSQLMVNSTSFNGGGIEKDGYGGAIFLDCRGGGCAFSITDNQFSLVRLSEGRCVFIVADDLKEVAHPMRIRVRRLTAVLSTDFRGAKTEDFDKMMEFVLYGKANSTNVCSNMKLNEAKDFEMETQDLHANYLNVSRYRTVYVDGADPNAEDSKACGTVGQPCKTFLAGAGRLSEDFCALCLSNSIEIRREMVLSSVEVQSCKSFERAQILIGEFDTNSTGALLNIFGEVHFSTCDFRFKNCETEHCSIFLAERNDLTVNNCSFSSFSEDYLSFAYVPSKKSPSHNSSIHPVSINASSKVTAALSCKLFLIVTGTLNMLYVTCSNLKFYVPAFTFEYNSQCSIIHSDFDSISLINSSLITKSSGKLQQKFSGKFELVNSTFTNIVCSQGGSAVLLSIDPFMPVKIQNCYFDGCGSNCSSVCGSVISVLFSGALISDTIFKGYKKPIPNERSLNEMNESIVNDVAMDIENKEEEEEDDDDVCGWRGAMMHLSTLPARLSNTSFINAPDGAVSMVSSSLAIASSSFIDNGVTAGKWKEIHHNIHCKGNGSVEVMSLAPDNSASNNRSPLWFQMEECSLILSPSLTPLTSSLFVPELTRVTYTANEQLLHMTFKGTNLFPCGLSFMLATSDPNDNPLSFEFSSFESSNIAYASVPISQLVFSSSSFSSSSSSPSPSNISVCNSLPSSHSLTSTQLSCEPKSSFDYSVNDTAHTQYVVLAAEKTKSKNDISKEQVVLFISLSIGLSVVLLGVLGVIV
ncbi:uncharacterized protein MONOS_18505 [Monocercomonoides exilis]|uniref:uncharacterized protein n=1 Tax=Monocercomonoides exilis TaxID=2049356 RepID=UPI003559DC34|nr:hypothetical protein MONOS_18505 [Monocercomonoides exilis]